MLGQVVALGGEAFKCWPATTTLSALPRARPLTGRCFVLSTSNAEREEQACAFPDLTRDGVLDAVAGAVGYWLKGPTSGLAPEGLVVGPGRLVARRVTDESDPPLSLGGCEQGVGIPRIGLGYD